MSTRRTYTFFHSDLFKQPSPPLCRNDYKHTCHSCGLEFTDKTHITKRCVDCRKKKKSA